MVLVLLVLPLLAMLSSGSRQSLGWTCVNVCSDRSNGDTGQVRVHVQCCMGLGWSMHCMPQASSRPRPLCGGEPQWQWQCGARFRPWPMALARRAASLSGQTQCACNLLAACGRLFGRGCLHDGTYRYSTQYVHIDMCSAAQHSTTQTLLSLSLSLLLLLLLLHLHLRLHCVPRDCLQLGAS